MDVDTSSFEPVDEGLVTAVDSILPCRGQQIRALATVLSPRAAPGQNIIAYGTEATGKTAVTTAVLRALSTGKEEEHTNDDKRPHSRAGLAYAIVNSAECITARHLFETAVAKTAAATQWNNTLSRCETLSQLTVELTKMLKYPQRAQHWRFVLVFDGIDSQRDAPPTLLPALGRLSEIIPCLTTVFIMTSPPSNILLTPSVVHVHFPNYTKTEFVQILSLAPPAEPLPNAIIEDTHLLWTRFVGAVHDALAKPAARTVLSLRRACHALWRRFTTPIREGNLGAKDFAKLIIAARVYFQDETLLDAGIIAVQPSASSVQQPEVKTETTAKAHKTATSRIALDQLKPPPAKAVQAATSSTIALARLLPSTARVLLIAAYLASHNHIRHDLTIFSTYYHGRRRKTRGGGGVAIAGQQTKDKHRKIARRLLGAQAFMLERMLAIYAALCLEWGLVPEDGERDGVVQIDADVGIALATLSSLRLLHRVGGGGLGGDALDRGAKWRVNIGWEMVRSLGRNMGIEVEEWLME